VEANGLLLPNGVLEQLRKEDFSPGYAEVWALKRGPWQRAKDMSYCHKG
jgi:hypothetical protein